MTTFTLQAQIEFEAEDIDDAMQQLGQHFLLVMNDSTSALDFTGSLEVYKVSEHDR